MDTESKKVEYDKYVKSLWELYAKAVRENDGWLVLEILQQIRLEVI